jgi:hypothetical protein
VDNTQGLLTMIVVLLSAIFVCVFGRLLGRTYKKTKSSDKETAPLRSPQPTTTTWKFSTRERTYIVTPHRCHKKGCAVQTWHECTDLACVRSCPKGDTVHTCHDSRCHYNVKHKCHNLDCKERKA